MEVVPHPPNRRHGRERARGGKGEAGTHHVTLVITVKKLDDCLRLRQVNLSSFRLGVLFSRPGNIISGRISCRETGDRKKMFVCDEVESDQAGEESKEK
ncbi:hypothetical protein TNCV_4314361 [Trichonephila clavipes]|nr:hypothetical protein TNCV_4314361 [Trichonephila clavipes]